MTVCILILVGAPSEQAEARPGGRLSVTQHVDYSKGRPIEGARFYLSLRRRIGSELRSPTGRAFSGAVRLGRVLPAGRYRIASWVRTCAGTCDFLDPPSARCFREIRIRSNDRLRLRLETRFAGPCTFFKRSG